MCQVHNMYGFKRQPGWHGGLHGFCPRTPSCTGSARTSRPRTPPSPNRCPAPCTRWSGRHRVADLVVVAGCGPIGLSMIAGAAAKFPARSSRWTWTRGARRRLKTGATVAINIAEEDAVAQVKRHDRRPRLPTSTSRAPAARRAVLQGLNILRKLGRLVEYSVFKDDVTVDWSIISDDKELDVLGAHLGPNCWPRRSGSSSRASSPSTRSAPTSSAVEVPGGLLDLVACGKESIKVTLIPACPDAVPSAASVASPA